MWAALADLGSVRHYNPLAQKVDIVGPRREGPGAVRRCEGPQGAFVEECSAWDPGRSMTMVLKESRWPVVDMRWTTEIHAQPGATLLTQVTDYRPKGGPIGAVFDALVLRRQLTRGIQQVIERFRDHVQQTARAPVVRR